MTINATWHRAHPMPKRPTPAQRMAWHRAHAARCACRPVPEALRVAMQADTKAAIARFFAGRAAAGRLFASVRRAVAAAGPSEVRVTRSQVAFRRRRGFAWLWRPDRWLAGAQAAPLVLSIALARRDPSARWKQVVEPARGRWMHHLELRAPRDVDAEVRAWLREAWVGAG